MMMFVMAFLTLTFAAGSQAALQAVGPVNPANGFPLWYQDVNGLTLDLCVGSANCLADPVLAGNAFSTQIGFGTEAFWWAGETLIGIAPPSALLVLATEAAFGNLAGDAEDGFQINFNRVRIRIDGAAAGESCTITHPFNTGEVFVADGVGVINNTIDFGCVIDPVLGGLCDFTVPLTVNAQNPISVFLTPVAGTVVPAGFIGDGVTPVQITGSPTGNNLFTVDCPSFLAPLTTDLFTVQGRFFSNVGAPASLALGNIKTGSTVVQRINIRNQGLRPTLAISPITVTPGDFTIASDLCSNVTLAANTSCEVQVRFTKATVGASNATLSIPSDDPQFPTLTVPLSATGVTVSPFTDVPEGAFADTFINSIFYSGITAGCGAGNYCPDAPVTRAQMAVFLETSLGTTTAPACNGGIFADVNATSVGPAFCGFVEKLSADGITSGCGGANFCPNDPITRGQMAVFIEAALRNPANACAGRFTDVPVGNPFCGFVERLDDDGITGGCGPTSFCPDDPVTRAQMAVFLFAAPAPLLP
jgi:hypothetical protein